MTLVNPHAYGTVNGSVLAQIHHEVPYEYVGEEEIKVGAGTFATEHWRITRGHAYDVWVHGPNRMMVKLVDNELDWGYSLDSLEQSDSSGAP